MLEDLPRYTTSAALATLAEDALPFFCQYLNLGFFLLPFYGMTSYRFDSVMPPLTYFFWATDYLLVNMVCMLFYHVHSALYYL